MKTFRAFLSALFLFAALSAFGVSDDGILTAERVQRKNRKTAAGF
jgi:hypothetical protein